MINSLPIIDRQICLQFLRYIFRHFDKLPYYDYNGRLTMKMLFFSFVNANRSENVHTRCINENDKQN